MYTCLRTTKPRTLAIGINFGRVSDAGASFRAVELSTTTDDAMAQVVFAISDLGGVLKQNDTASVFHKQAVFKVPDASN